MIFFLCLIQLLLNISIIIMEYKSRSISLFFWTILFILFSIPNTFDCFLPKIYNDNILVNSLLFVIGFEIVYIITILVIRKKINIGCIPEKEEVVEKIHTLENSSDFNKLLKLNIIVFLFLVIYIFLRFGSLSNLSWGAIYKASINVTSTKDKILEFLKSINHILFFSVSGLLLSSIYAKKRCTTFFITFIIIFYLLVTRNRIIILPFLISFILLYIIRTKKLSVKSVIKFSIIGMLAIYIIYAIWIYRHAGTFSNFKNMYNFSTFNNEVFNSIFNGDGELGLKNIFYYFVGINNNFPGLGKCATYIRLLLMFIPTKLCFGLKPNDFAITMSSAYMNNINNVTYSVHPTFYGDLFANIGYFGILFGVFWAIFFTLLNKYIRKEKNYIYKLSLLVLWGSCLVILARGSVYNSIYIGIIGTIILRFAKVISLTKN